MAVYATFKHNNEKKEHFIGIYPVSKVVTASLSAPSIMKSFEQYFLDHSIDLSKARFVCMEATNVNSEEKGRLKCLLKHAVPHLNWVGCGNHKLALCFKHLC